MRVKGKWIFAGESIPGDWITDETKPDNKRFEASEHGYKKLRRLKCQIAYSCCTVMNDGCRVSAMLHKGELHHPGGRGLGGSKRDDRETVWTCRHCHEIEEKKRTGTRWGAQINVAH